MKKNYLITLALVFCLSSVLFINGCEINIGNWSRSTYERTIQQQAALATGSTLIAETDVGSITVTGADVVDCNLTATIRVKAPTEQKAQEIAEQVKIELVPKGNTLTVETTKPPKKCKRSICISFDITVPEQTNLQLVSDVGKIHISDIIGEINARTDVGKIYCEEISGNIDLKTDVGKVKVVYSKTAPAVCNANIATDVGGIDFTSPANLSAAIHAQTDVGSIRTDLPITVKGKIGKTLHGTIGAGKGKITLRTDVGSIKIK